MGAAGKIGGTALKDQADVEKRRKANNFNHYKLLQYKMNLEKHHYQEKVTKHVEAKKELQAKVGPGTYINPKVHSEFRPE